MTDVGKTVSPKVVAGTAGAGAGAIVTGLIMWLVGAALSGDWTAAGVEDALAAVPAPLGLFVGLAVGVAFTFVPAWFITDHVRDTGAAVIQARPDDIPGEVVPAEPELGSTDPDGDGEPQELGNSLK